MDLLHSFFESFLAALQREAGLPEFVLVAVVIIQSFALWILWTANQRLVRLQTEENLRRIEEARESRRHLYAVLATIQGRRVEMAGLLEAEDQRTAELAAESEP